MVYDEWSLRNLWHRYIHMCLISLCLTPCSCLVSWNRHVTRVTQTTVDHFVRLLSVTFPVSKTSLVLMTSQTWITNKKKILAASIIIHLHAYSVHKINGTNLTRIGKFSAMECRMGQSPYFMTTGCCSCIPKVATTPVSSMRAFCMAPFYYQ